MALKLLNLIAFNRICVRSRLLDVYCRVTMNYDGLFILDSTFYFTLLCVDGSGQ